ncbi:MAG: pyridoxal-phosphate dependent enzyme [Bacteroidales bacterium]
MPVEDIIISNSALLEAVGVVKPYIHNTPVITSRMLNDLSGASLFFKCENFQKAGAFKSRGAANAILHLPEEQRRLGVCTHSSGNHAAALARMAKLLGVPGYIVMPENAPSVKIAAVKQYGGIIRFCKPTLEARESTLGEVKEETGAVEVHPYNNYHIIAGQSTACQELISEYTDLDFVVAPVGGGGLLSGTALSAHYFGKKIHVIGAEPRGADDAFRSLQAGYIIPSENPKTIADGLLTSLGSLTFPIIQKYVDRIITVSEEGIVTAMKLIWERMKIVVEPSSAVAFAAVLENKELFLGMKTGIVLSGGNVDLSRLPW